MKARWRQPVPVDALLPREQEGVRRPLSHLISGRRCSRSAATARPTGSSPLRSWTPASTAGSARKTMPATRPCATVTSKATRASPRWTQAAPGRCSTRAASAAFAAPLKNCATSWRPMMRSGVPIATATASPVTITSGAHSRSSRSTSPPLAAARKASTTSQSGLGDAVHHPPGIQRGEGVPRTVEQQWPARPALHHDADGSHHGHREQNVGGLAALADELEAVEAAVMAP